jgi:AraC family transcriptional regulator
MSDKTSAASCLRAAFAARLNRVTEYIDHHLDGDLSLDVLAGVAAFSKYHFHRLFHAAAGETLADYISRLRLQKAAHLLRIDRKRTVTDIALACGFSGSALFAKRFKARFGMTASAWRAGKRPSPLPAGRGEQQTPPAAPALFVKYGTDGQTWTVREASGERLVTVAAMPAMTLAYIAHTGPYRGDADLFARLFKKLFAWLGPRGLVQPEISRVIVMYHDDPDITPDKHRRMSVGCTVPLETMGAGEFGVKRFSPGVCAVSRFLCATDDFQKAWDWMYDRWLPGSGFMPADVPAFERYSLDAQDETTGKAIVDICIPVTAE